VRLSKAARDDKVLSLEDWGFDGIVTIVAFVKLLSEFSWDV
jgi:hypothetical protein